MKHLSILVPQGQSNNLSSIVGAYKLFTKANEFWKQAHKSELFAIQLVGISRKVDFYGGLFSVQPQTTIQAVKKTNLIIIPSLNHNFDKSIKENQLITKWITEQYTLGAELASICTGAFLLANTGLLDGKACSTHWAAADAFRVRYPKVHLQTDQLITDENGIYTNGGAYSFLHLMIYLIEKYYDRATAIYCSKVFQIDLDRKSQSPFSIFSGQKLHDDEVIVEAQTYLENNLTQRISIEELSAKYAIGRRNFDRRFIKATGNTPNEYVQRIKIEVAKKAFESTRKTIQEVMYEVGYADSKAFREVFRKITGLSPIEYKNKYNKELQVK